MEEIDASVDSYFSKFDKEETIDKSDSVPDEKEEVEKKETIEMDKKDTSEKSDDETDKDIPFHEHPRWKEVMKERKELRKSEKQWEKEKQELNDKISKLETKPLSDDELNNMTPKEIQEYTKKQFEKDMKLKQELSNKEQVEADKYISETLSDLKDAWHEFEENKLLSLAEKYTEGDLEKAFDLYQQLENSKEKAVDENKKMSAKKKAAEMNKWNKWNSWKSTWFTSWTDWGDLNLK